MLIWKVKFTCLWIWQKMMQDGRLCCLAFKCRCNSVVISQTSQLALYVSLWAMVISRHISQPPSPPTDEWTVPLLSLERLSSVDGQCTVCTHSSGTV